MRSPNAKFVGRVDMSGDPYEQAAAALKLASAMNGSEAVTDDDIALTLEKLALIDDPAHVARVRAILGGL